MDKTVKARFKQRADTAANWTAKNPVLLQGEIGYESDTNNLKVGDGKSAWASLPYVKEKLAKVATSGSYTDLSNKPTIPTVPSSLKNPYALTFTGGASGSYDGSAAKSVAIPAVDTTLSSTSTNAIQNKAVNTALTNKADKATTISGYGITDAKIENGTITLGSNSITPLVSHQSLSAYAKTADVNTALGKKADKATTLSGYGITDAKISNGVITLGTGTITPLTSHQSLSNYYKKTEVDTLITNLKTGLVNVVASLPTTGDAGKLYLVKTGAETQNLYTEYVYVNEAWEKLGTQKLDLSGYLTKTDASNTYLGKTATAASANKLNTDAGSATQPVYFSNGVPKATSYTLGKSVPSNAVFTDTNNKTTQTSVTASDYTNYRPIVWGASNSGTKGFTPTTVTDGVFTSANLYCQPSTGLIHATKFEGDLIGTASNASKVNNLTVETAVPKNAKFTDTNTTYSAGTGISLSGTTFSNSGVRSVAAGSSANQISVNTGGTTSSITINNVANATSASKLATARSIALGTGATGTATNFDGSGNITIPVTDIKESYLSWGGKNFSGTFGCIDAAMVPDLGANRLAFGKAAGIKVEYSTDSGSTWVDYGLTDTQKVGLFGNGTSVNIGKATTNTITTKCMLRVTIDSNAFGVYTALNKFVIHVSTNGSNGCYCTIDASLESSPTTFKTFANKAEISGWSGYNVINIPTLVTYGNSPSSQYGLIRFTFGCTGVSSSYSGLSVSRIMGFGGVGWGTPSNMAETGHLYSYDNAQNATFPASVTATSFIGNASSANGVTPEWSGSLAYGDTNWICAWQQDGKKIKAMSKSVFAPASHTHTKSQITDFPSSLPANGGNASTVNGHTVNSNVPANAKFTDTVYSLPDATSTVKGGVKVGSNITVSSGTISLTKANVTNALGYSPLGAELYNGFVLNTATSSIKWRQGTQPIGSIDASNYTGTANKAISDVDGKQINTTYAKLATANNFISSSNEFNFVNSDATAYNNAAGVIYINYRLTDTNSPTNKIKDYRFVDGSGNNLTRISAASFNGYTIKASVPANAKFTDTIYTHPATHPASIITGLATVATSGSYSDLSNKPTIPTIPASLPANGGNSATVNGHTVNSDVPENAKFTDTVYTLPDATSTVKGGVKVGSNITVSSGTISITKANVTSALGYTPPTTNTTYSDMTAATADKAGTHGLVPAPAAGKQASFLRGDGNWVVPTNTDTHWTTGLVTGASATAIANAAATNGNVWLNLKDNSTIRNTHNIVGTGGTTVVCDDNGKITINSTDNNTTYTAGTGISLSGTTFSNSGVRAISSGSTNGTISVNTNGTTANVAVKGLGSAAYTNSTAYASASHTHSNIISTSQSDNPIVWLEIS